MKVIRKLEFSGKPYKVVSETVRLSIYSPGTAEFIIEATAPVAGSVVFWLGQTLPAQETPSRMHQFFTGYVVRSVPAGTNKQSVFVKELVNVLEKPLPLSMRHVSARDVLAQIAAQTGLAFSMPQQAYSNKRTAYFYSLASGFHALDEIGRVFGIPDYIWQQNGDGSVYAGSWADSYWATRPVNLPMGFFSSAKSNNQFSCAVIPALRPGATMNGQRISDILFSGNTMSITCES